MQLQNLMMRKLLSTVILEEGTIAMPLAVGMAKGASHRWEAKKISSLGVVTGW